MKIKKEISAGGIVYKKAQSSKLKARNKREKILWLVTQHSAFGHWSFPKGLVGDFKKGEKIQEAAMREVGEEGGVRAEIVNNRPITVKYNYRWEGVLIKKTVHYFLMKYISGDPKDHDWEVAEARFTADNEVEKLLTFKNDKEAFKKAIRLLNG